MDSKLSTPNIFSYLNTAAKKSATYSERHFVALGWSAWVVPLATIVDQVVGQTYYDTLAIRVSVAVFAIPLLFSKSVPQKLLTHFHIYFVIIISYAFPFAYGYMLVMNAVSAPVGAEIHMLWLFQYVIALFLFIQLINNGWLITLMWIIASITALSPLYWVSEPNWSEVQRVLIYPVTGYLTALFFGIVTNRNIDIVHTEKFLIASSIGSNIAHELRTPLASVRAYAHGLLNVVPALIDGYKEAKNHELQVDTIADRHLEHARTALSAIENEVEYANTVIDMLLMNTANRPPAIEQLDTFQVTECIRDALDRYPFNNTKERGLIRTRADIGFLVHAPKVLIVHVLFNLIKNALYYVQHSGKGSIVIRVRSDKTSNCIEVHDTGPGISKSSIGHIFDRFYSTTDEGLGTGIGLSFCKMVMESLGGNITCDSVEGEYTTFSLAFPKVTSQQENSR